MRRCRLKKTFTDDRRTDGGWTNDRQRPIKISHVEPSAQVSYKSNGAAQSKTCRRDDTPASLLASDCFSTYDLIAFQYIVLLCQVYF